MSRFNSPVVATAASSASKAATTSGGTAMQVEPMFETIPRPGDVGRRVDSSDMRAKGPEMVLRCLI